MEKKIEYYLHLYPKCQFLLFDGDKEIIDISEAIIFEESICFKGYGDWYFKGENDFTIKLILRPLSDMTEEEIKELFDYKERVTEMVKTHDKGNHIEWDFRYVDKRPEMNNEDGWSYCGIGIRKINPKLEAHKLLYLLKQGFDLFGLIEAGLAIDKTTLNP